MRPRRVLAIARRDLALELKGRRGWVLPLVMAGLLAPVAALPEPGEEESLIRTKAGGAVPEQVAALPGVDVVDSGGNVYFQREDGVLLVHGSIDASVREALDQGDPVVEVVARGEVPPLPGRTMFLALLAAASLTGGVSQSVGGERSAGTLGTLLTAAITRWELALGKWLAWGGFGAFAAGLAAAGAVLLGRAEPGWWMVPLPTVPLGMVALGLYMVRRASDVIGGATVSLRVLPAVLMITGIAAWFLGGTDPLLGAAVPLGGALVAAGAPWPGAAPSLLAAGVTLGLSLVAVWLTGRDLDPTPPVAKGMGPAALGISATALAVAAWWSPVVGPELWSSAGNAQLAAELRADRGVLAGGLALLLITAVRAARVEREVTPPPPLPAWLGALAVGGVLAATASAADLLPWPEAAPLARARLRLASAMQPTWAGPLALGAVIWADELLFRGWLQRRVGPLGAVAAYALVHAPLDPLRGIAVGGALSGLTVLAGGSIGPALVARLAWVACAAVPWPATPALATAGGLALAAALLALSRRAPPPPAPPPDAAERA